MYLILKKLTPLVFSIMSFPAFYSCNLDDLTIYNSDPNYTLVYSSSSTYSVRCGNQTIGTGSLDYIDLRNSDSVNVRFKYSLTNNLTSHFVIYYNEGLTERKFAEFRFTSTSGTYIESIYIRNVNLYQIFNYRISVNSNSDTCEFKVSDLRIYKKLNN